MSKQKIRISINPLSNLEKSPVDIVELGEVLDFVSAKFEIDSINIQLNEKKKPSELYFSLLSGLCKTASKNVVVENYVGNKKPNTLKLDSFSTMILIIDNLDGYTLVYNNEKHSFKDVTAFRSILDIL